MVHELTTVRTEKVDKFIGRLGAGDMRRVELSLAIFLGLHRG